MKDGSLFVDQHIFFSRKKKKILGMENPFCQFRMSSMSAEMLWNKGVAEFGLGNKKLSRKYFKKCLTQGEGMNLHGQCLLHIGRTYSDRKKKLSFLKRGVECLLSVEVRMHDLIEIFLVMLNA